MMDITTTKGMTMLSQEDGIGLQGVIFRFIRGNTLVRIIDGWDGEIYYTGLMGAFRQTMAYGLILKHFEVSYIETGWYREENREVLTVTIIKSKEEY